MSWGWNPGRPQAPGRATRWAGVTSIRDRLLASPRFRAWATAFPLTRPIAKSRARDLFDLCAGFVYAQVLYACVRLELFTLVAAGPLPAADVAARTRLSQDAAERLLGAAVSLRLLERRGQERFGLGPLGAALLNDPGINAMIAHHALLYADLADPVALLRGENPGHLASLWPYAGAADAAALPPERVADYSALMAATQPMVAAEILAAYPIARHARLLDIAGGEGAFLREAARAAPNLSLALFDLPAVVARARDAGLAAELHGGDIRTAPPPRAAFDLVTLIRVIHDHDDELALTFLRAAHDSLTPGGTLLLAEPMAGAPTGDAYFGFYLLAMGTGRARSAGRLRAMLAQAGFQKSRVISTRLPLVTGLIAASRGL